MSVIRFRDIKNRGNLNRQLIALNSTLGEYKTAIAAKRCRDINPDINFIGKADFLTFDNIESIIPSDVDYIIDAIDLVSCKLDLIETAMSRGIPIISSLGTGNKFDPTQFVITDISKTKNCPLARVMRKELRERGIRHLKVVFSPEQPAPTDQLEAPPPGRRSVPASVAWVPSCAGLMMAGAVIQDLIQEGRETL